MFPAIHKRLMSVGVGAAVALLGLVQAEAATFGNFTLFNANNRSVWGDNAAFVVDTGPKFVGIAWNEGAKIGGVECALFACVGAEIGANTSGRFGFDYGVKINTGSFDLQLPGYVSLSTPDATSSPTVGAITVGSSYTPLSQGVLPTVGGGFQLRDATLQVHGPTASAYLDLAAELDAFAGARVCVIACYGPALGPIGFNESRPIASINRDGDGKITLLGQSVGGGQQVTALGGLLHASLEIPDLDGSSLYTPGGYNNGVLTSIKRDHVATVTGDLAQIAAYAGGLPIPLTGNVGPIGYTLIQAGAGVSIDVEQTLRFAPEIMGRYVFSGSVTPIINGVQGAPTEIIDFRVGDSVTFLPGQVGNISYIPIFTLGGTITNSIDMVLGGTLDVKALGLNVAGLSLGPIVDEQISGDLGRVNIYGNTFRSTFGQIMSSPINLDFASCRGPGSGPPEFPVYGICASSGYTAFPGSIGGGFMADFIDGYSCSAARAGGFPSCFAYAVGETSPYFDFIGGKAYVDSGGGWASFTPLVPGASTTDADQRALIAALGYPDLGPFVIPEGAPLSSFPAPEPGTWLMMLVGFGLLGVRLRARRGWAMA